MAKPLRKPSNTNDNPPVPAKPLPNLPAGTPPLPLAPPKPVLQANATLEQRKAYDEAVELRILGFIQKTTQCPNPFAAYLADKCRESRKAFDQCGAQIDQAREVVKQLERQISVLEGEHNKYIADLRKWDEDLGVLPETVKPAKDPK